MPARTPEAIHALMAAVFNAGDLDGFVELHEEGAQPWSCRPEAIASAAGRRCAPQPTFALRPTVRNEVVDKLQGDGIAVTRARWTLAGSDGGQRVELSGGARRSSRAGSRTAAGASHSRTRWTRRDSRASVYGSSRASAAAR